MRSTTQHLSKYPPFRGGMDKVLRLHAADGAGQTLNLLRLPEGDSNAPGSGIHVPMGWLRRRLAGARRGGPPGVSLYYNCWGADVMAGADRAEERIGYLHNFFPHFERYVRHYSRFLDGFLSVSAPMHEAVLRTVPAELRDNSAWVPYPVEDWFQAPATPPATCVLGVCGRIARAQKRVDRLPETLARLDRAGLDYRLELLGDGPDRAWLAEQIGGHPRVLFHGWREGAGLVAVMQGWKYLVSLSDYEGQSLALLEGIAAGCLPLYPDFHAGRELPPRAARACLYRPGDLEGLLVRLVALERMGLAEAAELRAELAGVAAAHRPACYAAAFADWRARVRPVEGRSARRAAWRLLVGPVWAYNRFYRRLTHGA